MRPVGPDVPPPVAAILTEMQNAIVKLQQPGRPQPMARVALKADLPAAADYPECAVICDEINSLCVSTFVSTDYAWKRADGGAL